MDSDKIVLFLVLGACAVFVFSPYDVLYIGIGVLLIGIALLVAVITHGTAHVFLAIIFTGIFLFTGISIIVLTTLEKRGIDTGNMGGVLICGVVSASLFSLFFYDLWKVLRCTEKIMGQYKGCKRVPTAKGPTYYEPIFAYEWQGRKYKYSTGTTYTGRRINKKYQADGIYPIYLNPNRLGVITDRKRITFLDVQLLIWGTIFLLLMLSAFLS